jgi:hypothetical protein
MKRRRSPAGFVFAAVGVVFRKGPIFRDPAWAHSAMRRAMKMMSGFDLDVKLVS